MYTYFDVIPEEIVFNLILTYLDNKSIYNFYLSRQHDIIPTPKLQQYIDVMRIKEPIRDKLWDIIEELMVKTNAVMAGSYVLKNLINENWRSDVDIYISEQYQDIIKEYINKINEYFDRISSYRITGTARRGRYTGIVHGEFIEAYIDTKDPSVYFKLQGFDLSVPDTIYEIEYIKGKTSTIVEIVVIKQDYDVIEYMRKITDFRFLRNFLKYNRHGRPVLVIDYPKEVFNKIMELNHDKKIKSDRFYKYEQRGFKYFKDDFKIDKLRALDLYRGFQYPNLVGYKGDYGSVLHGQYPDTQKLEECVQLPANINDISDMFSKYFNYIKNYMSKERFMANLGTINTYKIASPDILIVSLRERKSTVDTTEDNQDSDTPDED